MQYAVVKDSKVINAIEWDGKAEYIYPEENVELVQSDEVGIGDSYVDGKFIRPEEGGETIKIT